MTSSLYEKTKKELEIFHLHKSKGALIRSRLKQIEEGERNSKYFLNMEINRRNNNTIFKFKSSNRSETDPIRYERVILNEILKKLRRHFQGQ